MNNPSKSKQSKRFIEKARELGCDEDEAAFERKLRRIAKAKPKRMKSTSRSTQVGDGN